MRIFNCRFKGPKKVGEKLFDLTDYICGRIEKGMCGKCYAASCDNHDCPDKCYGLVITGHLVNQIGEHIVRLVDQIFKEWEEATNAKED